jgi:trimethylamine--corrinoid protein Co-methyltransferase
MHLPTITFHVLDETEMDAIFQAGQRVLASVPLWAEGNDEFFDTVRAFGCQVDGHIVRFSQQVIDTVLQRIKQYKAERQIQPEPSLDIQPAVSGQGIWYSDVETDELRLATCKDLATLSWIVDALPGNVIRSHPTFIPQDIPIANADLYAYAIIILNASRPHPVSVYSRRTLDHFIEISDVVYGSRERTIAEAPFKTKMWITTPFKICRTDIEIALAARRLLKRPVVLGCMPVIGHSTPVTLAGGLTQAVAEGLMQDVLSLAFNGDIFGQVPAPLVSDMRIGSICEAGPDNVLAKLGAAQMGQFIYGHRPVAQMALTTMAKAPGPQAILEKMGNGLIGVLTGARTYSAVGMLASTDIGSFVQLMIDLEITSYFQRLLEGIRVTPEAIAEEVIAEVAPTGAHYLEHDHTLKHFRQELWLPELADRRMAAAWRAQPTTMLDNARAKARRMMETAVNRCPLDERQKSEIQRILATADQEIA